MDLGLAGSRCVVVGGSSGIGLATARLLAAEGARVLVASRSPGELDEVETLALDATSPDAPERLQRAATERLGGLDHLVYSAGSSRVTDLLDSPPDLWREQWQLNVVAPRRLIEALAPALGADGGGTIVNVASSAGRRPSATDAAYAVAKRGQLELTVACAARFRGSGVRVLAVAPGPTATPLWMAPGGRLDELAAAAAADREETLAKAAARLPLGRLADPEEIAAVVAAALAGLGGEGPVLSADGGHVTESFP